MSLTAGQRNLTVVQSDQMKKKIIGLVVVQFAGIIYYTTYHDIVPKTLENKYEKRSQTSRQVINQIPRL